MTSGSSKLTPEQTDEIEKMFGLRYSHVQANASVMSRKDRRRLGHRTHYFGRGSQGVPQGR